MASPRLAEIFTSFLIPISQLRGFMADPYFGIADLIDYDIQVYRDTQSARASLEERDAVFRRQGREVKSRSALLLGWLSFMREQGRGHWPGEAWEGRFHLALLLSSLLGLITGLTSGSYLLESAGQTPIIISDWYTVFVFLPVFLLVISAFLKSLEALPLGKSASAFKPLLNPLANWIFKSRAVDIQWLRRFRRLYSPLIDASAWQVLQVFGLFFYAGALFVLIKKVIFLDLSFAWTTTLHVDAAQVHDLIRILSLPFSWIIPIPSEDIVRLTQYSRLEGRYLVNELGLRAVDPKVAGQWWPFLAASVFTYGVLPRLLIVLGLRVRLLRFLRQLRFDDLASHGLLQRISPAPEADPGQRESREIALAPCAVLKWRDVLVEETQIAESLARRFRFQVAATGASQGSDTQDQAFIDGLRRLRGQFMVLVLVDPWERPGVALEKLLGKIRRECGANVSILIAPLSESSQGAWLEGEELRSWRQYVSLLNQPYTGLLLDFEGQHGN